MCASCSSFQILAHNPWFIEGHEHEARVGGCRSLESDLFHYLTTLQLLLPYLMSLNFIIALIHACLAYIFFLWERCNWRFGTWKCQFRSRGGQCWLVGIVSTIFNMCNIMLLVSEYRAKGLGCYILLVISIVPLERLFF